MLDPRFLAHRIGTKADAVNNAAALDYRFTASAARKRETHCTERFQRISLCASAWRSVGFARAGSGRIVEDIGDRLGRNARAIVSDGNPGLAGCGRDFDPDFGCDLRLLGGIERVVETFLQA